MVLILADQEPPFDLRGTQSWWDYRQKRLPYDGLLHS